MTLKPHSIHGPSHWQRVEEHGQIIAEHSQADALIVTLFAMLHDCQRLSDGRDPDHGPRAAILIRANTLEFSFLSEMQLAALTHACEHHTHEIHHPDITIGACYDADRLDLPRVGIRVDPRFLNTDVARTLAQSRM